MVKSPLHGPGVRPASGGEPRQLIVFLHGVGADGNDLIGLAPYFADALPDAEFLSPDAPFPCDMAPFGRQWFSLQDFRLPAILRGIRNAAPVLDAFLDHELAARGLSDDDLAIVGFSQGTMMALHVALRRPVACRALVGYSGLLAGPELLPAELTVRPRVLLAHGEQDEVVPFDFMPLAKNTLERMQVPVLSLACPGLGHSIGDEGLSAGVRFVADAFAGRLPDRPPV
jgi:phospholipase/carboxylesterase